MTTRDFWKNSARLADAVKDQLTENVIQCLDEGIDVNIKISPLYKKKDVFTI